MSSYNTYPDVYEGLGWGRGGGRRTIGVTEMRPSQLRFTHDSISSRFKDGGTLEETFRQLLNGEISIKEVRSLVAMEYQGYWFVVRGNRRLYIMKKLEQIGNISTVTVLMQTFDQQVFAKQFSTKNMGVSLKVRGDLYIEQKLNQIVSDWRTSTWRGSSSRASCPVISSSTSYSYPARQSLVTNQQARQATINRSPNVSQTRANTHGPTISNNSKKEDDRWCIIL